MSATLDATTQGARYQQLLDADSRTVPDVLRWQSPMEGGPLTVPVGRYTSPEFHRLEVEKVWTSATAKITAEIQSSVSVSIEINP